MVAEDFLDHDFCLPSVTARTGSDLESAPSLSSDVAANEPGNRVRFLILDTGHWILEE
jgi:hypothetical protein